MSYRPKHTLIIVVNADGSGYAKQFDTLAEAKNAYKAIVTDGVAFLYPSPRRSVSSLDGSESIPDYNNFITYGTGDRVRFQGKVYQLINFIGAAGYTPASHPSFWTDNVKLPAPPPPISSTGLTNGGSKGMTFTTAQNIGFGPCPPLGMILQTGLNSDFSIQINGVYYIVGNATYNIVADGNCGTTQPNTALTFVPAGTLLGSQGIYNYFSNGDGGYYEDHAPDPNCDSSGTILEQANSSPILVTISGQFHQIGTRTFNIVADGNCGSTEETTGTEYIPVNTFVTSDEMFNFYSDGIGYVYPVAKLIGYEGEEQKISLGWTEVVSQTRTREKFSDGTFGEWSAWQYVSNGTSYGSNENYNYYADGNGSYYTEQIPSCDPSGTFLSGSSSDISVNSPCNGNWTVGQSTYSVYADGNCGTYEESGNNYYSMGQLLGNCNDYNYYADGAGWYYQGEYTGGGCPSSGEFAYSDECNNYYHDGSCGYYSEGNGNCGGGCESYGTFAYSDECSNYYHDGNCGYYSESNGNCGGGCEDSTLHSGEAGWTYDGCYWSYSEPCPSGGTPTGNSGFREMQIYISELGNSYWHGDEEYVEYADGNCGSYDSVLSQTYFSSGRVIVMNEYYDDATGTTIVTYYVADGNGGYYVENW